MKRSHVVALVLVILLAAGFSYAGEDAIRIGGIYVKIGMSIDELKRILPAKYTLTNMDELGKEIGAQVPKVPYTTYMISSSDDFVANIFTVKNNIVVIEYHVGAYGGDEVMGLGDSIYSAFVSALENKPSSMAFVEAKTARLASMDSAFGIDSVAVTIGKRRIVISVERGEGVRGVSVSEVLGPVDLVEELLRKQPRNRIPEKRK